MRFQVVAKRSGWIHLVAVAPPFAGARNYAARFQFRHDALNGALGDAHANRHFTQRFKTLVRQTDQHMSVIGQKSPARIGL